MQYQSLMFALFMLAAIPLMFLLSDHDIFFLAIGFFLLIYSIKNTRLRYLKMGRKILHLYDENSLEDLEEETKLNIRKISTGTRVVKSLVIILFVLYCTFYTKSLIFDMLAALICVYHISDIHMYIKHYKLNHPMKIGRLKSLAFFGVNIATVIIIIVAAFNKFMKNNI